MALLTDSEWHDSALMFPVQLKVFRFMLQRAKEIWREKLAPDYASADLIKDKIAVQVASEIINNSRPANQSPMHLQQVLYAVCEELDVMNLFENLGNSEVQAQIKAKVDEAIELMIEARYFREKPGNVANA